MTQDRRKRPLLEAVVSESDYLDSVREVKKFWSRFPVNPEFPGKKVLDLGCGLGAMVFHAAKEGAARAVGIEILDAFVQRNRERTLQEFPELSDKIDFRCHYLSELEEKDFDIILSKDSFEHILELEQHLREMKERLAPGGRIYVGFAPLYRSPRGDHRRTQTKMPWGHMIFPERVLIEGLRELYPERDIKCIEDLGLNKVSLRDLKAMVTRNGLRMSHLGINVSQSTAMRVFNLGRMIPGMSEYFTHNVYAIIEHA